MRTAWITLRHNPPYRCDAFMDGMEKLGFSSRPIFPEKGQVKPQDVVITWNLNPRYRGAAWEAKKAGAALIVAENGYLPRKGSKEPFYALARDGHNGSGFWFTGKEDRWSTLGYTLQPWQSRPKGYILVADQRGIGSEIMKCPRPFFDPLAPKIRRVFAKVDKKNIPEVRLRPHPGRHAPKTTLEQDLSGARAVVTWASNVANISLLHGIPTFRLAPFHVNAATITDLNLLPDPPLPDRLPAFQKLAWAQWSLSEIQNGTALRHLLQDVLP